MIGIGTALIVSAIAALVGSVAGGLINSASQQQTNEANLELTKQNNEQNIKLAQAEMAFNSAEAQKQRDFELMLSNTAVQRRMADLQAAGVNPMLAVGSPAQMASGYAASASTVRTQAGSVEPVQWGSSLSSLASIAQSAAMMMALSKIKGDYASKMQKPVVKGYYDQNLGSGDRVRTYYFKQ